MAAVSTILHTYPAPKFSLSSHAQKALCKPAQWTLTSSLLLPHFPLLPSLQNIVLPKGFLQSLTGKHVLVKLKWGLEYKGE